MKISRIVFGLYLLLASLLAIYQPTAVLAQDEAPPEETIELIASYPKMEAVAGGVFEFEVEFKYQGIEARVFDLVAEGPKDWAVYMTQTYAKDKRISAIRLEPATGYGTKITVMAASPFWLMPEPGDYKITVEASSGEVKGSIELTTVITARYTLDLVPATERYNTSATAGKDNYFSIEVQNQGTAAIENITFSASKPSGWTIEFSPDKVDSLDAVDYQTIDVNIKPPSKTIAGDYEITLRASGKQASAEGLDIRVTVETSLVGQWVGVGIIVLVIAGLIVIFMRFSRR